MSRNIINDNWSTRADKDGTYSVLDRLGEPVCTGIDDFVTAECIAATPRNIAQILDNHDNHTLPADILDAVARRRRSNSG